MANPRQLARQRAVQALYSWQLTHGEPASIDAEFRIENDMEGVDLEYFRELLREIPAKCEELDAYIRPLLPRPLNEVDPVERAILRMGAYELKCRPDVPYRVVINEGVELTKVFGAEQGHRFVNGILDGMARALRGVEQAADERPIPEPAATADATVGKGKFGQKRAPLIRKALKKRVIKKRNIVIPKTDGAGFESDKPAADAAIAKRTPLKMTAGKKPMTKKPATKKSAENMAAEKRPSAKNAPRKQAPAKSLYGARPAVKKPVPKMPVSKETEANKPESKQSSASLYGGKKKTDS